MTTVRNAEIGDAGRILEIYRPFVEKTAITFEYTVPTLNEFRERMENTMARYPYLAIERDGRILGYAYAGAFHPRAAYSWCAELSIYLDREHRGQGLGRILYTALEERLKAMGILNLYACIAVPDEDDEYLDHNSIDFHSHLGFRQVGFFTKCGYKFDRWYNMVWMEKIIGKHSGDATSITPYRYN